MYDTDWMVRRNPPLSNKLPYLCKPAETLPLPVFCHANHFSVAPKLHNLTFCESEADNISCVLYVHEAL
jgi:hypothetical protein